MLGIPFQMLKMLRSGNQPAQLALEGGFSAR